MGETPPTLPSSDPSNELSKFAKDPYMKSSWLDLPIDLLLGIIHHLELQEILVFAAVCSSWCSAATAAGVLPCQAPRLMSWALPRDEREQLSEHGRHGPVSNVPHPPQPRKDLQRQFSPAPLVELLRCLSRLADSVRQILQSRHVQPHVDLGEDPPPTSHRFHMH